ncbi:hypothetical protein N4Q63_27270, partial [Leclercia adecarboxylata]|uniref:hypothetical protein n=1 Tax=Leclercia adecarboxylata TaxID=83655 RepID=UPI00234C318F|nr:hypothetical protein [Leclercia adecarboxylata]
AKDLRLFRLPEDVQMACLSAALGVCTEFDWRRYKKILRWDGGTELEMSAPEWIESVLDLNQAWPVPVPPKTNNYGES